MPKLCGQDLAEQIGALRPGIKVVFMSGYAGDIAAKHGAFDPNAFFLQKPFEADALWRLLRQVLSPVLET